METHIGTGNLLTALEEHPYIEQPFLKSEKIEKRIFDKVNKGRPIEEKRLRLPIILPLNLRGKQVILKG